MEINTFKYSSPFSLESSEKLTEFELAYTTYGELSAEKDNVVWACHALTANSTVDDWWEGLFGKGSFFDPAKYFIICANMLGSCYGSTHPLSINPETQEPYYHNFPQLSIRDMVRAFDLLRKGLGISKVKVLIGGSMGGQQVLEWAILQPSIFEIIVPIATNAQHSPWGIAFNESQRMAIAADVSWKDKNPSAGLQGLRTARSIALLSYRNYTTYEKTQTEQQNDKLDNYLASSYQQYQGDKLVKRFDAFSYWVLSKAMDSHHVGRERNSIAEALTQIKAHALVLGISSDILFPIHEQKLLQQLIPNAHFDSIESLYGHDGFLIETEAISDKLAIFLQNHDQVVIK